MNMHQELMTEKQDQATRDYHSKVLGLRKQNWRFLKYWLNDYSNQRNNPSIQAALHDYRKEQVCESLQYTKLFVVHTLVLS